MCGDGDCDCENCQHDLNEKKEALSSMKKWKYTLITTVIFLIVVHPNTYLIVNKVLGKLLMPICNKNGCPTKFGLLIHASVFTLIIRYTMDLNI